MAQSRRDARDAERDEERRRTDDERRAREDERRAREAEETGHQANVNQVRHEPMPASHHDDPRQEAVERNEEYAHARERREG
jgi:hypothetical protein